MSVNKAILLGRLGQDPELKYTSNQTPVCNFSLATSERRKDQSGNWNEQTEWHRIVTFGKTAENVANYLKKGRECFIDGRIQTRKWQDRDGNDRYTTEVVANTVQFVGGRGDVANMPGNAVPKGGAQPSQGGGQLPDSLVAADSLDNAPTSVNFDDDDIPF